MTSFGNNGLIWKYNDIISEWLYYVIDWVISKIDENNCKFHFENGFEMSLYSMVCLWYLNLYINVLFESELQ